MNVRRSRLSREVAAYGAFVVAVLVWRLLFPASVPAGLVSAAAGMLALFAMDRVYDPVRPVGVGVLHSADVALTGPLMGAAILQWPVGFAAVAAAKAVLFGRRALRPGARPRLPGAFLGARVGLGLVLPPVIWVLAPGPWGGVGVVLVALAELADRGVFYEELNVTTPRAEASRRARGWGDPPVTGASARAP
jgi:DMSO reductase anchor subunit